MLLVLQGMDTSGKGGTLKHTVGLVDPQGVKITSFKAPTKEELAHDFLWRIRKGVPGPGVIGVFDRSHYEDVLIARVRELAPRRGDRAALRRDQRVRGGARRTSGVTLVKCMLHISPEEQKARLLARLDDPTKHWKYNPGDLAERARWGDYRAAYEVALERNNTEAAPWHVIPADKKWYRNLAVGSLLLETLRRLDPQWPTGRLRRRGREAAAARRGADLLTLETVARHPLRHPAPRGRQPARHRRGRRPGHLRLQVPRRRPGHCACWSPR